MPNGSAALLAFAEAMHAFGDTRIAVWMLEAARRAGVTDAELLQDYPGLDARDLAAAWSYVDQNVQEIDDCIGANAEA